MSIEEIKQQVLQGVPATSEQALYLMQIADKEKLYEAAHEITFQMMGSKFDTCSIVNARSGNCSENCKWCAQSSHYHTEAAHYPLLSSEECLFHAKSNDDLGIRRFALVTSGKRVTKREIPAITDSVLRIKKETQIKVCASMGLLRYEELKALYDAGVENYHCNIETAPSYFKELCTTHTIEQKMETIRMAREIGFRVCSGGIIGMGETNEQRVEMALFLQKHQIYSIPLNILHPIKGTPLENMPPMSDEELLTTIAMFRFTNPKAFLRFSGGRKKLLESTQKKALYIGINSAITGDLLTTSGCDTANDFVMFTEAGYNVSRSIDTNWEK